MVAIVLKSLPMAQVSNVGPFGSSAVQFAEAGCAVLPCGGVDGKRPLVKNWNKWSRPTSHGGVDRFREKFSAENIGLVCGPASGITVIDLDDPELYEDALQCFGGTALQARSPRTGGGFHLYYRHAGENGRAFPGSDIKAKGGFVIAPPSLNPKMQHQYQWIEGSGSVEEFQGLKAAIPGSIDNWAERFAAHEQRPHVHESSVALEGSRNDALFKALLLAAASWSGTHEEFLTYALKHNQEICRPSLPESEVTRIAHSVLKYQEEDRNWTGKEQRIAFTATEIQCMEGNGDALMLYEKLKRTHSGFDKAFCVSDAAMANGNVISGWGKKKYRSAREFLADKGLITMVHKGGSGRGDPHRYRF